MKLKTGEYDDVLPDEIDNLVQALRTKQFDDIYIQGHRPFVSLDLRKSGIKAYISAGDPLQYGIISKIREIINQREKKHFGKLLNILQLLPTLAGGALLGIGEWKIGGMLIGLSFLMIWPIVSYQMAKKIVVFTSTHEQRPSLFRRKKDDLFVASISALIGAIISFILTKYL